METLADATVVLKQLTILWETEVKYIRVCAQLHVTLGTPRTVACQAPLTIAFSRQEHWSGLPFPIPGDLPAQGSNSCLLHLLHWQVDSLPLHHLGSLLPHSKFQVDQRRKLEK